MEACEPGFILLIVKILIAKISYPFIQAVYAAWMNAYSVMAFRVKNYEILGVFI